MYLNSGTDYYIVVLKDLTIVCKSGLHIISPNIIIKLLSYPDINKLEMMQTSGMKEWDINEEICSKCIISIIGFETETIDLDESPAGIIDHIATKIKLNSLIVIEDLPKTYIQMASICSILERLAMVVAHYSNNTYEYTQQLPIDELLKRYAICSLIFRDVPPIESTEEEESKIG